MSDFLTNISGSFGTTQGGLAKGGSFIPLGGGIPRTVGIGFSDIYSAGSRLPKFYKEDVKRTEVKPAVQSDDIQSTQSDLVPQPPSELDRPSTENSPRKRRNQRQLFANIHEQDVREYERSEFLANYRTGDGFAIDSSVRQREDGGSVVTLGEHIPKA